MRLINAISTLIKLIESTKFIMLKLIELSMQKYLIQSTQLNKQIERIKLMLIELIKLSKLIDLSKFV